MSMIKHFEDGMGLEYPVPSASRTLKRRKPIARTIKRRVPKQSHATVEFIGSGSSELNLALSGKARNGGWARGRIGNIVGDRSAGKTVLGLESCFWFFKNIKKVKSKIFPPVKKFHIIYNNSEGALDFDVPSMYGQNFYNKVEWIRSPNVEHFGRDYARRVDNMQSGDSLLYVLDTLDFLRSYKSIERFKESIKADDNMTGSYDAEKQKFLSAFFGTTSEYLEKNKADVTLLVVSQVRDILNKTFGFGKKQMRTGGRAFGHAIHQELWIREIGKIKLTRKGKQRVTAIQVACKVEKNKCAKPFREAEFQIVYDYGIDNLSSMIKLLWGSKSIKFDGQSFSKKAFIKYVEENDYEHLVEDLVEAKWVEIEESFSKDVRERKQRW